MSQTTPEDLWDLIRQDPRDFPGLVEIRRSDLSDRIVVTVKEGLSDPRLVEADNLYRTVAAWTMTYYYFDPL